MSRRAATRHPAPMLCTGKHLAASRGWDDTSRPLARFHVDDDRVAEHALDRRWFQLDANSAPVLPGAFARWAFRDVDHIRGRGGVGVGDGLASEIVFIRSGDRA